MPFSRLRPGVLTAIGALLIAVVLTVSTSCSTTEDVSEVEPSRTVTTSTTKIAGAGVLGNHRRPDESCAPAPAPAEPSPPARTVNSGTERGDIEVPADPQRIVALDGDQLDALCALGLQSRVVAAALPDGSATQPSYLGTAIHDLPAAGTRSAPDAAAIAAATPDLILGSNALTPQSYGEFSAIAPTVFTHAAGSRWQDALRSVGAATGRSGAVADLIDEYTELARETGVANDAGHYQVSVVQLTETTLRVYGADNFAASVLATVGVDRPAAQRFTDKPYIELGIGDPGSSETDLSAADGDIIYVSFASPAARERGPEFLDSAAWRDLSATRDNRVFAVNNEIWQSGQGIIAARGIVDDLRLVNAPIN